MGFAETLRVALRQDLDVILIGAIRDDETASIVVKASLTGHLVLSTLHSKGAVPEIQRLLKLGFFLDLLAESLTVIVSQRLVRPLCSDDHSKKPLSEKTDNNCLRCRGTGYSGRIPLTGTLKVNSLVLNRIQAGETGNKLIQPDPELYFYTMEQTVQRLAKEALTGWKELQPLLLHV